MTLRHAAGGAGQIEEPEHGTDQAIEADERAERVDDGPDGGAPAAIQGTSLAGPAGGTVGAMGSGSLGTTVDDEARRAPEPIDDRDPEGDPERD